MDIFRALICPDDGYQTMTQLSLRAVAMFAFGIVCIRIAGRRTFSQTVPLDIIVYLSVGSNLSRAITGKANVLPTMAATLALVIFHRLLTYLTLHRNFQSDWIKGFHRTCVRRYSRRSNPLRAMA